jgi:PAS domain S-box-containing protein
MMWVTDPEGACTHLNRAWYEATGQSQREAEGFGWLEATHPDDRAEAARVFAAANARREPFRLEYRLRQADGSHRWAIDAASPRFGSDGEFLGYIGSVTDIHERKLGEELLERRVAEEIAERTKAEEQLRQSQKMEAVGQLTGGLAHDFNNLLAGISGSLELMGTRLAQGRLRDVERYMAAAQGAARRAAALTHRLLAFARRQTLEPRLTDVTALVMGMEELIRRTVGPSVAVESIAGAAIWTVSVDPNQLENALLNLAINARDAMPNGGRLTLETANRWLDERAAAERDLAPGQYVSICVSDTGSGMTPDVVARAFDPFFTTKPIGEGTGLGLSMVFGFVRQSGGQARIYSEVGQGTMVCLYLPRHLGEAENDTASVAEPVATGLLQTGETVLVIDDEPVVRMLVAEVLEEMGCGVLEAGDGPEGLRLLEASPEVDLLITDVGLPGGLNGRQVADAARALRPGLKVLFITGYAENAVFNHGHLAHGMHVVTKPFGMEDLGRKVRAILSDG